jgi:hypothetical protein
VLYDKAIEVLLMTWNVEGHDPVELDEAVPRLAYVAFSMLAGGTQQITKPELERLLEAATVEMPDVLGFARLGTSSFIDRIEDRSSLLTLTGYEEDDGVLAPLYEFKHLTFQEYLAGVAIARDFYPGHAAADSPASVVELFVDDESWREVIPIAAVLLGRRAGPVIGVILDRVEARSESGDFEQGISLLARCLADEVQLAPDVLKRVLSAVARGTARQMSVVNPDLSEMLGSRYGDAFVSATMDGYFGANDFSFGSALGEITLQRLGYAPHSLEYPIAEVIGLVESDDAISQSTGALAAMSAAYDLGYARKEPLLLAGLGDAVAPVVFSPDPHRHFAAAWALAWLGATGVWTPVKQPATVTRLLELWRTSADPMVARQTAWAIAELPLVERDLIEVDGDGLDEFLESQLLDVTSWKPRDRQLAALIVGYYAQRPWSDEQLVELARERAQLFDYDHTPARRLLTALGVQHDPDDDGIEDWDGIRTDAPD